MATDDTPGSFSPDGPGGYIATETALSVLARKLRAELTVALLEDFVTGRRTGRAMLADFRNTQRQFRGDMLIEERIEARPRPRPRRDAAGTADEVPEWERLRQQARTRGRPIALWELFHGLDTLIQCQRQGLLPADRDITVVDIENAMDLTGGVGESWSLHAEVAAARAKLGEEFIPSGPGELAGMLLRVDAARTLIKPGGYEFGIRPIGGSDAPTRGMSPAMMHRMNAQVEPQAIRAMTRQAAVGLVGHGARSPQQRTDLDRATRAGQSGALARRAEEVARAARTRATELRAQRSGATSSLLFAATAASGLGLTGASLVGQTGLELQVTLGLSLAALGAAGNFIKDWTSNRRILVAPYQAFIAERVSDIATRLAVRDLTDLDKGAPANAWRAAGNALRSAQGSAVRVAVNQLDQTGTAASPSAPKHRRDPGRARMK